MTQFNYYPLTIHGVSRNHSRRFVSSCVTISALIALFRLWMDVSLSWYFLTLLLFGHFFSLIWPIAYLCLPWFCSDNSQQNCMFSVMYLHAVTLMWSDTTLCPFSRCVEWYCVVIFIRSDIFHVFASDKWIYNSRGLITFECVVTYAYSTVGLLREMKKKSRTGGAFRDSTTKARKKRMKHIYDAVNEKWK